MALSEKMRMEYEQLYLENRPPLPENEVLSPDKTVISFGIGGLAGVESLVLKLVTDKGTETLSLNPIISLYLAMILTKGVKKNKWIDVDLQIEGRPTQQ